MVCKSFKKYIVCTTKSICCIILIEIIYSSYIFNKSSFADMKQNAPFLLNPTQRRYGPPQRYVDFRPAAQTTCSKTRTRTFIGLCVLIWIYTILATMQSSYYTVVRMYNGTATLDTSRTAMIPLERYRAVISRNGTLHMSGDRNESHVDNKPSTAKTVSSNTINKGTKTVIKTPKTVTAPKTATAIVKKKATTKKAPPKPPPTIPSVIKSKLVSSSENTSLKIYSSELYAKSKTALSKITKRPATKKVPTSQASKYIKDNSHSIANFQFNPDMVICKAEVSNHTTLILFTTMFHTTYKQYLFNNTLTNYALLKPYVLPVLFITDTAMVENSGHLINKACEIGWTVIVAPVTTQYGFPILNAMYFSVINLYPSVPWVGYTNADILYTQRLPKVLDYMQRTPELANISFMSSRRINTYVSKTFYKI